MTQRTIYTLIFTLGGLILTLPSFGNSITSNTISPRAIELSADTFPDVLGITELTPFHVERVSQGISLEWVSSIPSDLDSYELQHVNWTPDAPTSSFPDFSTIGRLENFAISDELEPGSDFRLFSYLHRSPSNGVNYYRLKITDTSGNTGYSDIIAWELDLTPGSIFPSIVDTSASLFIESPAGEPGELKIYDMNGRLVYSEIIMLNENSTLIGLDFTGWDRGYYVTTVSGEQLGDKVIRFVKN